MTTTFDPVAIGGGGYFTGIDIASDGTMVARIDVYGAYRCNGTGVWRQLVTTKSMPGSLVGLSGHQLQNQGGLGVFEIRIAPSNSQYFYMLCAAQMLVSPDQGANWTLMSNWPTINWATDANSGPRLQQCKMAVDPANPDIVFIGTPVDGLFVTKNGRSGASATFTPIAGVPGPISGGYSAQVTGSISGNILTVTAVTRGPLTFGQSLVGAGISSAVTIEFQIGGTPFGVGTYQLSTGPNLGSQTFYADARNGVRAIVFDPSTVVGSVTQTIYACTDAGVYISVDAGTTWNLIPGSPTTVNEATVSGGVFYPTNSATVYVAQGQWTTSSTNIVTTNYRNVVGQTLLNASNGNQIIGTVASMSATGVTLASAAAFASRHAISSFGAITPGSGYTNGTYSAVPLTGGTGTLANADITVAGGVVTAVTLNPGGTGHPFGGTGFTVGDTLSAASASIGGTGSGFSIPVTSLANDIIVLSPPAVASYTPSGSNGASGTWNNALYVDPGGATGVAVNPLNSDWMVVLSNGGGYFNQTGNLVTGAPTPTWNGSYVHEGGNPSTPPSDAGWLADTRPGDGSGSFPTNNNWSGVCIRFDPIVANRVWMAWGYGVSYFDLPNAVMGGFTTPMSWATHVAGTNALVARTMFSGAGYAPLVSVEDQQVFQINNPNAYPPGSGLAVPFYGAGSRAQNSAGWSVDGSLSVSGVRALLSTGHYAGNGTGDYSSFSIDGGSTWTLFPHQPTFVDGGDITCVDATHFVAVAAAFIAPVHTTDAGATAWPTCGGLPAGDWIAGESKYNGTHILTNDAAGNVYGYLGGGGANGGTYRSIDKGANFTHADNTDLTGPEFFETEMKAAPGIAGKLFLALGPGTTGANFYTCLDNPVGPITWTAVPNVEDVYCFGFGPVAAGFTAPLLWIVGWVNKGGAGFKYGVWKSRDLGVSDWTFYVDYPGGNADVPVCITGDMNLSTTVYIGFQGTTAMFGVDSQPPGSSSGVLGLASSEW